MENTCLKSNLELVEFCV